MASNLYGNEELTCMICHEDFGTVDNIPKMLDCHHTFCVLCLKKYKKGPIVCPYKCKTVTKLDGRPVDSLLTNFYILPRIEKKETSPKHVIQCLFNKALNNRAEAITMRREVVGLKLSKISESFQFMENQLMLKAEDNNEHVAILQSLLESGLTSPVETELPPIVDSQADLKTSEEELEEVKVLSSEFISMEKLICQITLTDPDNGKVYNVKGMEQLSFNNSSNYGQQVGASVSVISYGLQQLKAADLWEEVTGQDDPPKEAKARSSQQVTAIKPLGKENKQFNPKNQPKNEKKESPPSPRPARAKSPAKGSFAAVAAAAAASPVRPFQISPHEHGRCYLQFSINGEVKPAVVIKLCYAEAPIMCTNFLKYILGTESLSYQLSPLFLSMPKEFISFGEFSKMCRVKNGPKLVEEDHRFIPDRSSLAEKPGALRMRFKGDRKCGSEFSISVAKDCLNRSKFTTIFGYVIRGLEVCEELSCISAFPPSRVVIQSCGASGPPSP